jgi:hypothetical protein
MQQVIELQQIELRKRGDDVEARAKDIANTFVSAVATFEQVVTPSGPTKAFVTHSSRSSLCRGFWTSSQ